MDSRSQQEYIGYKEAAVHRPPSIGYFSTAQFWDGRASTLEEQSTGPFVSPVEHGFANHDELVAKLKSY